MGYEYVLIVYHHVEIMTSGYQIFRQTHILVLKHFLLANVFTCPHFEASPLKDKCSKAIIFPWDGKEMKCNEELRKGHVSQLVIQNVESMVLVRGGIKNIENKSRSPVVFCKQGGRQDLNHFNSAQKKAFPHSTPNPTGVDMSGDAIEGVAEGLPRDGGRCGHRPGIWEVV